MKRWTIKTTNSFEKEIKKLDKSTQIIIMRWIDQHLSNIEDPRSFGKPLVGNLRGYWRYRIGDYRLIVDIIDDELVIIQIKIGHRKQIYDK